MGCGAKFHRAVRENLSDKVNFKVRSEDSKRRVFQAIERVVTMQSSWTGETVKCVCKEWRVGTGMQQGGQWGGCCRSLSDLGQGSGCDGYSVAR